MAVVCVMRPHERVEIARAAYRRAVALVRAHSTPSSWRRAVTASRNLATALRDRERALGERARVERAAAGPATVRQRREPPDRGDAPGGERQRDRSAPRAAVERGIFAEMVREWERAQALMAESRRLVLHANALRAQIASLLAGCAPLAGDSV